jgi:1,4-alpha-glucan branching enzyme
VTESSPAGAVTEASESPAPPFDKALGHLALVLHAHLPWVRHPEHPEFLEEDWLFEAITETYLPLLAAFERLDRDRVPYRVTVGVTPPLQAMLADELLRQRYRRHLAKLRELAAREARGNAANTPVGKVARFYRDFLDETHAAFEKRYRGDLVAALAAAQDRGSVELITCTATHAFLPLVGSERLARAQVRIGARAFERSFGRRPRGIWLGECAYRPGVDRWLAEEGIDYFFVDQHGVANAVPRPVYGIYAPIRLPGGSHAIARDGDASRQVWSAREGYPGDPTYREFYRDLGYDADYSYIRPYLHGDGVRRGVGLKYHRVTGAVELHEKDYYDPAEARRRAGTHARHFLASRMEQARWLRLHMERPPLVVAPYDAELFGHWWFEGPWFLEDLLRGAAEQDEVRLTTVSDDLALVPRVQRCEMGFSSWGAEGYGKVWLNAHNAALYRHQHHAERRFERLLEKSAAAPADERARRVLVAAGRELLLAQSSDWAFIVTQGTSVPYAVKRFRQHLHHFHRLCDDVEHPTSGAAEVPGEELSEAPFPWLELDDFGGPP